MLMSMLATSALLLAVGVSAWFGAGPLAAVIAVAVVALILLMRHDYQISRLIAWTEQPIGTPLPEANGSWSNAFLALHRRAREAARQRDELQDMVERFRLAAEALPEGVVILDQQYAIEWLNPRAEHLLGLDSQRDVGLAVTHLVREPEFVALVEQQKNKVRQQAPLIMRPLRYPERVLQIRGAPFSAGRTLLLVEDLTQLDRLETVRRDFVANVSHEMRTPLTVVLGFLETSRDSILDTEHPTPPDEIAKFLDMALDHSQRMRRLIEDLLTLSTLETDALPQEEAINVVELLSEVLDECRVISDERHTITLDNSGPAVLIGSRRELHSAFSNLASNAVRYTPSGGQISLAWRPQQGGGAIFAVTDSGIGIEAAHIPRLTERFYRVDHGRSRDTGGTGLGLAIVKHVLERHQATLAVESKPGAGSRFAAIFPARRIG